MTDNSGTTADEQSNRIGALAALDRAIDSQYRGRPDTAQLRQGRRRLRLRGDNAAAVSETVQFARNGGKNDPPARR
jgi:hypothetical protein